MRTIAKAACGAVPDRWLLGLRSAYLADDAPATMRRLLGAVLGGVRLRGIPQDVPFTVPGSDPVIRMTPSDSYIAQHLYWLGFDAYETGQPTWWAGLVRSHRSALEIGANIGLYTVVGAMAAPTTRYQAVEASPASGVVLRQNVRLNGLEHVEVHDGAVVGARGAESVRLRFPEADPYASSAGAFVDGALDVGRVSTREVVVPAIPIADLVAGVDLLKLDIEGLELEVLSAVRSWLVATHPTLLVESCDTSRRLHRFLVELADEAGYVFRAATAHGVIEVPPTDVWAGRLQSSYATRDVTLITPSQLNHLE